MRELPRQLSVDELSELFEGRTRLVERLAEIEDPLDQAGSVVTALDDAEKVEALAAHPAIGQRSGLSARSAGEQGDDSDPVVLSADRGHSCGPRKGLPNRPQPLASNLRGIEAAARNSGSVLPRHLRSWQILGTPTSLLSPAYICVAPGRPHQYLVPGHLRVRGTNCATQAIRVGRPQTMQRQGRLRQFPEKSVPWNELVRPASCCL